MRNTLADLWKNLTSGFAFALFMRRGVADFRIGIDQLVVLLLFSLLLDVAVDHINHRPDPSFNHTAFASFGLQVVLFSLAAYLLALSLNRRDAIVTMITLFFSANLLFALGVIGVRRLGGVLYAIEPWLYTLLAYLYLGWLLLTATRAALHAFEARRRTALLVLPVLLMVWLVPIRQGEWEHSFWQANYPPRADAYAPYRELDAEALFHAQPQMVAAALGALAPQRAGVSDLYFVSFGSYAYQDVFMKEARYAQQTMDQRFDTAGRSLQLVNNLQTREQLPLASESNLRMVLQQLGRLMDTEQDVLMLYLTSHGGKSHELAVDFWPLPLNDITPQKLRTMLDEAGITWRVVVVSACYSGGFVEALRDDHTLVATAAAADRQSFGCGNEDDFTYFGEALFHQELGGGVPLLDAFARTREAIAAREQREKLEPSKPQLHVGRLIERKLAELHGPTMLECGSVQDTATAVEC